MREILFRGKRTDNSEWVYGYVGTAFTIDENKKVKSRHFTALDCLGCSSQVIVLDETIGLYTGLKDKNGVRIFEGDIVECWSEGVKARGTVQQRIDGLWIIYPAWQKHIMWGLCPDNDGNTTVEVIGNIHDNPELLKGGEK